MKRMYNNTWTNISCLFQSVLSLEVNFQFALKCNWKGISIIWMAFKVISLNFTLRAIYYIEYEPFLAFWSIEVSPRNIRIGQRKLNLKKVLLRYEYQNHEFAWLKKNKKTVRMFFNVEFKS